MELGNALRSGRTLPPNKPKDVEPIIAALSEDSEKKLDEVSSVIVITEAGDDFPQHIMTKIIGLEADKRAKLKELVSFYYFLLYLLLINDVLFCGCNCQL